MRDTLKTENNEIWPLFFWISKDEKISNGVSGNVD